MTPTSTPAANSSTPPDCTPLSAAARAELETIKRSPVVRLSRLLRLTLALTLLFGGASAASAQTTKFLDNCLTGITEDLDVQSSHTTDTGASPYWAELIDSAGTQSLRAHNSDICLVDPGASAQRVLWVMTPSSALGSADYDVFLTLAALLSGQADDDLLCVGARITDATHGYLLCIEADNNPRGWGFYVMNGSSSGLSKLSLTTGSGTYSPSANDIMKLTLRGDTLRFYGGATGTTEIGCAVDATLSSTGQAGVGLGNFGTESTADPNSGWSFDVITIVEGGSGTDDNCGGGAAATPRGPLLGVLP